MMRRMLVTHISMSHCGDVQIPRDLFNFDATVDSTSWSPLNLWVGRPECCLLDRPCLEESPDPREGRFLGRSTPSCRLNNVMSGRSSGGTDGRLGSTNSKGRAVLDESFGQMESVAYGVSQVDREG